MNEARVTAILAAYGADPARWPDAERQSVQAWLAAHPDALPEARADAGALDALLSRDDRGALADAALMARVLAQRETANVTPFRARRVGGWSGGAIAALAACAVMGVVIGFSASNVTEDATAEADAAFGAALGVLGGEG